MISPTRHEALTAMLGPTNTGKTYFAIERLLSYPTGMIGLPLRLLAREVYDKLIARRPAKDVALITGEEKIASKHARYWVCTVEAMPLDRTVAFMAIDEIQLAGDLERGRVFTSRLLHARGTKETLFLGSATMRPILKTLFPSITFQSRERLSALTFAGSKKVTRLPRRSAVVAFSADTVYSVAELIRRQRGGAAVVLGALSPRTRNAQAELYQSGEVDYLVATDAIGMGLNMDIDHAAFAARRKFDGRRSRLLRHDELAQIAGRAGRHMRDGTFGITADCPPLDDEAIEAIEEHRFAPVKTLQWRSEALDFSSAAALNASLAKKPPIEALQRARIGEDEETLDRLLKEEDLRDQTKTQAALALLWDVCQIPDFRKVAPDAHARLVAGVFRQLTAHGRIMPGWFEPRLARHDRTDGGIDDLSARLAHMRTWAYLANRSSWLDEPHYWQERTRRIEDALSDALHEKLTQRFVDRRTSVLLKKLKDDAPLLAGVTDDGDVIVEGQFVGRLMGFDFIIDPRVNGADAKRMRTAADKALTPILATRAAALANAKTEALSLASDGVLWWRRAPIGNLAKGPTPLRPELHIRGLDRMTPSLRGRITDRLKDYLANRVEALLAPLLNLAKAADAGASSDLNAASRGIAFRLVENFGAMSRVHFGDDLRELAQEERAKLRQLGVRFGEYTVYAPALLKPAPAQLLTLLWAIWTERAPGAFQPPKAGLVSLATEETLPHAYYYACGYRPSGTRAVRIDMLERLAGQIRSDRKSASSRDGFEATAQMMSLVGSSGEDFESILKSLGYRKNTVKRRKPASTEAAPTPTQETTVQAETPAGEAAAPTQVAASPVPADPKDPTGPTGPMAEPGAADPGGGTRNGEAPPAGAALAPDASSPPEIADDGAGPAADEAEEMEITLWRMAPRRPTNAKRGVKPGSRDVDRGKSTKGKDRSDRPRPAKGERKRRDASPYAGPARGAPKKGAEGHAPRHRKVADPNSPFAVLAALKGDDSDDAGKSS